MSKNKQNNILEFTQLFEGRTRPNFKDVEKEVLGGLIMNNKLIDIVISILLPEKSQFYVEAHNIIYNTIIKLYDKGIPVDIVTLSEELKARDLLDKAGGFDKMSELTSFMASLQSIEHLATLVQAAWVKRELIDLNLEIADLCFSPIEENDYILNKAQKDILDITNFIQRKNYTIIKDEVKKTMDYVEDLHERQQKGTLVFGVPTGYDELDAITGGFQKSELIIIAGRPSHGKTALALNFARNAAIIHKKKIGIFSIEMSNRELALRFICLESKVDLARLKTGTLPDSDWAKIAKHTPQLMSDKVNILIDDSTPLSLLELRAKTRRMKSTHNIDMIMIDYLQLMEVSSSKNMDRHLEIAYITRGLKQLAKELDIPVVALSQLSRKVEERAGKEKRPQLSDLRESGAIEQDADVVIFINRPEVYISKDDPKFHEVQGLAEVIVGKQRNGPIGEAKLTFIHNYAMFANRAKDAEPTYYAPQDAPF